MKFFLSYSSGLSCSPEPFTFVSLLSLSLSLEATCLFYHFYAFLSTPFFAFCFFLHFISLFLSLFVHFALLLCSFHTKSDNWASLSCHFELFIIFRKKINSQNRSSVSHWRRHPDLNWGSRCCRPMPYHLAIAPKKLERITRLELATSTLARWRSTRWAKSAFSGIYNIICKIPKPDT